MRPVKFRGKTLSGEWAYGSLIKLDIGYIILTNEVTETSNESDERNAVIFSADEIAAVNPETVGQFTGMLDKNGIEIYEGDILGFTTQREMGFHTDDIKIALSVVFGKYNPDNDVLSEYIGFWAENSHGHRYSISYQVDCHGAKVIGNIYDNPELLKGDKQ